MEALFSEATLPFLPPKDTYQRLLLCPLLLYCCVEYVSLVYIVAVQSCMPYARGKFTQDTISESVYIKNSIFPMI